MIYWIVKEGRWVSIFITEDDMPKNSWGEIIGNLYNLRRKLSQKRIRLCWKNIHRYTVNCGTAYDISPNRLSIEFSGGPYKVDWK